MKKQLKGLIEAALRKAVASGELALQAVPDVTVEVPREQGHGDLATNVAMVLAREARKPPRAIASTIVEFLEDPGATIRETEIAGPGFINFTFSDVEWRERLLSIIEEGGA